MNNEKIYFINSKTIPEIAEVGGKGYSLIKLSSIDINVPNGIILTVSFFDEWINKIKNSDFYKQFLEILEKSNAADQSKECTSILNQIKDWCLSNLVLTKENIQEIEQSIKAIFPEEYNKILYAVRSSSPEEDLSGASFAGNYETYLGINFESLEHYVLKSFISCLDFRVYKYKLEKGFNGSEIKIAIVIMKQIDCDVSGVGFSINPLNNDYDEAVITSNFGLGESVVGGIITPDEYIVNKLSKKLISQKLGTKDKIVKLNIDKNETSIIEQAEEIKKQSSLNEKFLMEILDNIITIENHYKVPIDIEFGIENDTLYILQARPITTYNKIPKELFTHENEKRQLYFDVTVVVQGFDKPLSTLGSSVLKIFIHYLGIKILGSYNFDNIRESAVDVLGGKFLINVSNLSTKLSIETLTNISPVINNQVPDILSKHGKDYKNSKVCHEIDVSIFGMMKRLPILRFIFYKYFADSSKERLNIAAKAFMDSTETYVKKNLNSTLPVISIFKKMADDLTTMVRDNIFPVLFPAMAKGYLQLNKIFDENFSDKPELRQDLNDLTKSLPYITILMGLDLYKLSKHLDKEDYRNKTQEEFYQDFLNKKFPDEFYEDYESFMKKYGHRCEGELDIKNARYTEHPEPLINQIYTSLLMYDENNNPQKDYDETNARRPEVFKKLQNMMRNKKVSKDFEQAYNLVIKLLCYRESPKYYIIFIISKIKEVILERSKILLEKHLIDDINDIYKLDIHSISDILSNVDNYTKEKIAEQMEKDNELYETFHTWNRAPFLFDSRGKILTAEKKVSDKKNELIGDSVSYGKVVGKAKVLNSVNEKEFNPGEILITKATDPGWTPLIINCGGIVLEVGGMLQHGALVSREFNKPCVVGIDNVVNLIKDGETVEVDAIEGVVRLLDREA